MSKHYPFEGAYTNSYGDELIVTVLSRSSVRVASESLDRMWHVPLKHFLALLNFLGRPCLNCDAGSLTHLGLMDPTDPGLVCGRCGAAHSVRGAQLTLTYLIYKPRP